MWSSSTEEAQHSNVQLADCALHDLELKLVIVVGGRTDHCPLAPLACRELPLPGLRSSRKRNSTRGNKEATASGGAISVPHVAPDKRELGH